MSHDLLAAAAAERHQTLMTEAARRRLRRAAMAAVADDAGDTPTPSEAVTARPGPVDRARAIARYIRSVEERLDKTGQICDPARSLAP